MGTGDVGTTWGKKQGQNSTGRLGKLTPPLTWASSVAGSPLLVHARISYMLTIRVYSTTLQRHTYCPSYCRAWST